MRPNRRLAERVVDGHDFAVLLESTAAPRVRRPVTSLESHRTSHTRPVNGLGARVRSHSLAVKSYSAPSRMIPRRTVSRRADDDRSAP